ncbi:MAG TPA: TIGR03084 family metal-binding protein [Trebonia sp.]|jgi:uncharacterized protein (TIGR03084 family)|nr:TIGR03084 family metal-binding protein [Trebonia sp.]
MPDAGNAAPGGGAPDGKAALVAALAADLAAETASLAPLLTGLSDAGWLAPTPAAGWTIRDQVTHLAFFNDVTALALQDPAGFAARRDELLALGDRFPDVIAERFRHLAGPDARRWFTTSCTRLASACRAAGPAARLPWFGPDFSVPAAITGRIMETWAHGEDITAATGTARPLTARLRHVAEIGIRARRFSFASRGLPVPPEPVYVELAAPDGSTWTWGAADAVNRVTGDALDFCLVVTQRRNVADTGLRVAGDGATAWIAIAQAFAGRPTDPPPPGSQPGDGSRP